MSVYITIEVVKGGFVLDIPQNEYGDLDKFGFNLGNKLAGREVFVSERKLLQKLKDALAELNAAQPSGSPESSDPS